MRAKPDAAGLYAGLPQVAALIGQFVAPASLLAGLLFYWGFFHLRGFCGYYGVNSSVLGFSTTDYVMRSNDGLFVPVAVYGVAILAAVWGWSVLPDRIRRRAWPPGLYAAATVLGVALLANGVTRPFRQTVLNRHIGVAPTCVIVGLLLLWGVVTARRGAARTATPLEWAVVLLLIGGSFFNGAAEYSLNAGVSRAGIEMGKLAAKPGLVVYSEKDLSLRQPGVVDAPCAQQPADQGVYRHRYSGLVLLLSTGDALLVVPRTWTPAAGSAVVLPRTGVGALRLQFTAPRAALPPC
ncbi:MAG: hypothetical protein HOQ24_12260 [Mycobacteriaceae bacterium]|nr:hypothetical protein [Mycobacteriaceae bacterium]